MKTPNELEKLNAMDIFLQHHKVDISAKDKLKAVQTYLETGNVTISDSLALGIDPWVWPNFEELYVRRLALIVEELIDSIEQ